MLVNIGGTSAELLDQKLGFDLIRMPHNRIPLEFKVRRFGACCIDTNGHCSLSFFSSICFSSERNFERQLGPDVGIEKPSLYGCMMLLEGTFGAL